MKPFAIMGEECRVTASIGISVFPKDGQDEQTLMKNADIAMYLQRKEERTPSSSTLRIFVQCPMNA